MFCNICGAQLEENTAFCTQCGAPVQSDAAPAYAPMDDHPTELFSEEPVAAAPAYDPTPAYEAPAYEAPAYEAPAYDAPAYDAPAYDAPAYDAAPAYVAPEAAADAPAGNVSPKSRTTTLILSILLGSFGINRLYLGAKGGVSRLIMAIFAYVFYIIGCFVWPLLFVALPLLIIVAVGGIKDIIRSAKGTMVDGDGLTVSKW